MNLIVKESTKC